MFRSRLLAFVVFGSMVMALVPLGQQAAAVSPNLVISQVYGGGGNSGAPYTHDYIEIFNRSNASVPLAGLSLQYTSATGTGNFGSASNQLTELPDVSLGAGQYYLVQEAVGANPGIAVPADFVDPTPIAMAAGAGKVAIVTGTTSLGCNGSSTQPCDATALARIIDLVGYGNANFFEGAAAAPTLSNTTAAFRAAAGCQDTDNNNVDFSAAAPSPRNSSTPAHSCTEDNAPEVTTTSPSNSATGVAINSNISVTFSEAVTATGLWYSISCATSGIHSAVAGGGPTTFGLNPDADFVNSETCTVTIFRSQISDQDANDPPDHMTSDASWTFTTASPPPPPTLIREIQGASHLSPKSGQTVSNVRGIVTATRSLGGSGFYMQDPAPDANDATSEAIFVFTNSAAMVSVGDSVTVNGSVSEFRPGGASSTNLTTTELVSPTVTILSTGNPLPAPIVIGIGGRVPPSTVIEDDATGSVETSGVFDPSSDGIDFYESLEAMRVQVNGAVAVDATDFGETPVLADNGAGAGPRTARGGILYGYGDGNPERIFLDDEIVRPVPILNVGDHFTDPVVGVVDYSFGNFKVELTEIPTRVADGVGRETAAPASPQQLSVATFNVENLSPADGTSKFNTLADLIVNRLRSPDVITLEEVQDNNGVTNDSVVDASTTLSMLVSAIAGAGGPTYDWRQINPVDDQDGGAPGGNIRQAFLFRTDRGLAFVDRPGGTSTAATSVNNVAGTPQLSFSPGRIAPSNSAWNASRKPLAAEFTFNSRTLFLIANHFNSKGGDQPLVGRFQPPTRSSEVQRHQQAQIENDFVDQILGVDPNANVIVLGDINDFEFSVTMDILTGEVLTDLFETLPAEERYSYVFEGNSQSLDHILVSDSLFDRSDFDVVHVNAEFGDQASDHDPMVALITLNDPPAVSAGGPYSVTEGGSVTVSATGTDPEGGALTYAWDLDNNGTYETAGRTVTFSAASLDGPTTRSVGVRVTDTRGLAATASATVNVTNVAPTATFNAPSTVLAGSSFVLSLTNTFDPSAADTAAGFTFAFDCGAGYGAFGASSSQTCPTTVTGERSVSGKIADKDGGVTEYHATVHVVVTFESLCVLVRSYATKDGIAKSLCAKLDSAAAARERGNFRGAQNILNAFRNEVEAQRGKSLTSENADTLIALAGSV